MLSEITDDRCLLILCAHMDVRVSHTCGGQSQLVGVSYLRLHLGPGDQTQVVRLMAQTFNLHIALGARLHALF